VLWTVASFLLKLGAYPKQILSVPVVERPRNRMNGTQLPLRVQAHEIGKLSAAEVVGHEVRKAINGFRSASFDVY
jgi:hypothetical protein